MNRPNHKHGLTERGTPAGLRPPLLMMILSSSMWKALKVRWICCLTLHAPTRLTSRAYPSSHLADQYIAFIERARKMRLELAADYLVMAAWLTYLKSRLLIPQPPKTEEGEPLDMAARLAFRLQRLQAMRDAAEKLMASPQLGRDVYERGAPEPLVIETQKEYGDTLLDLLKAYAERRQHKMVHQVYTVKKQATWSIKEARETLERLIGVMDEWGTFDRWLEKYIAQPETRRSVRASSFTASLELAREGVIELRQDEAFQPIFSAPPLYGSLSVIEDEYAAANQTGTRHG